MISTSRHLLPALLLFGLISTGCGVFTRSVDINYQIVESFPDRSALVRVWTNMGSDEIEFGTTRVVSNIYRVIDAQGDSVRIRVWYPVSAGVDTSRLVVLLPPHGAPDLAMFPIAAELTRRGLTTAMVSLRSTGLNAGLPETFGLKELDDIRLALQAYREMHSLDSLHIGLFGSSLGGVIALNLLKTEPGIEAVVLEGVMPDLEAAAKQILPATDYRNVTALLDERKQTMASYSPDQVVPTLPNVPILAIWGSDDGLVSHEERAHFRQILLARLPQTETVEIAGGRHTMRFGFPLSASDAVGLNARIADFIARHLR